MVTKINAQLLCTFSNIKRYDLDIKNIQTHYEVVFGKVYVLHDMDNLDSLMLTYNVNKSNININNFYMDTISVHRKKDSNTLYTINSLNSLIRTLNNGIDNPFYKVNWSDYKNCILLTNSDESCKFVYTKLFKIVKI
jgi:hypothetical protein